MTRSLYAFPFIALFSIILAMEKEPNGQNKAVFEQQNYSDLKKEVIGIIDTDSSPVKIHTLIIHLNNIADEGTSFISYFIMCHIIKYLKKQCENGNYALCEGYWSLHKNKMLDNAWENYFNHASACKLTNATYKSPVTKQFSASKKIPENFIRELSTKPKLVKAKSENIPNNRIIPLNKTNSEQFEKSPSKEKVAKIVLTVEEEQLLRSRADYCFKSYKKLFDFDKFLDATAGSQKNICGNAPIL